MSTDDPSLPTTEHLGSRLEFETLLADLSSRFINLPPGEVDREIEEAQGRICELLGLDVSSVWTWSPGPPATFTLTHLHRILDGPQAPRPMHTAEYFPWIQQQLRAGRTVVVSALDELPVEAARDRQTYAHFGIRSALAVPLSVGGGSPICAVSFDSLQAERDWPDAFIKRLQLVAQVFANALARRRHELDLVQSESRLASGAELAGLGYYEVDFAHGALFTDARFREICGLPADALSGLRPLEFWLEHLHPDDRPRILELREQMQVGTLDRLSLEYRFLHPTRGERWMQHLAGVAGRDGSGRAVRTYGVLRDITAPRQAEESLRQSYAEIERLKDRLQAESEYLKAEIGVVSAQGEVIGRSAAIQRVLHLVEQVAPTDSSVLVLGETGTGKELIAQAIHRHSPRRSYVMVRVNCAALPSGLIESELFGREKGAFTGALSRQVGRFEIADHSTIFLDEIGELSLELQAKLLRVLDAGEIQRLGSPRTIKVDVRVIAATNRDLVEEIRKGRFREDLYYRLNVFPIRVPPLRERSEDIPLLVWAFLGECSARMGKKISQIPRGTMDALQSHPWPGNVRELRNVIEHGAIVTSGDTLRVPALAQSAPAAAAQTLAEVEREHIVRTLERTGWRIKGPNGAAAALGLNPSTLYSRMKKLAIEPRPADEGSEA